MKNKIISLVLSAVLIFSLSAVVFAVNTITAPADFKENSKNIFKTEGKIALTPGEDGNDINFSWITEGLNKVPEKFVYSLNEDLSSPEEAVVTTELDEALYFTGNKVSLKNLEKGVYYYSYTYNGMWQATESFEIFDDSAFAVMFCSDPQLGRSGDDSDDAVLDDCYAWGKTLSVAKTTRPDISFGLCAGDMANMALSKKQYNAYLYPDVLRSLPVATAVGNHDFYDPLYEMRFNNPNETGNDLLSPAGKDYYFTYGNALFVVINTNNILVEDHKAVIATAINNNPDCKWRVVMMHESPYFSGMDGIDNMTANLYTPIFDEFDIDLVLSGHEHTYSRTVPVTAGMNDENGVTYLAASTASGCSYDSYETDSTIFAKNQNCKEPSYSVLDFSDNDITVKSYFTVSGEVFDEFTIEKDTASSGSVEYEYTDFFTHIIKLIFKFFSILLNI